MKDIKVTPEMRRHALALKHAVQKQGGDFLGVSWASEHGDVDGDGLVSVRVSTPDNEWAYWKEGQR